MELDEAAKQVIKEWDEWDNGVMNHVLSPAIERLRQAIEQAEKQEPVAWVYPEAFDAFRQGKPWTAYGRDGNGPYSDGVERIPLYTAPVHASDIPQEPVDETAKDKQKPVAWWDGKESVVFTHDTIYTPNWTDYWTKPLYEDPTPCQTCQALAMSVMADHVYHEQVYQQREWVGLTDEDYSKDKISTRCFIAGAKWAEAKLKEKNT